MGRFQLYKIIENEKLFLTAMVLVVFCFSLSMIVLDPPVSLPITKNREKRRQTWGHSRSMSFLCFITEGSPDGANISN